MKVVIGILIAGILVVLGGFFYSSRQPVASPVQPESQNTVIPSLEMPDQCKMNVLSDNRLFEDRMTEVIKTCSTTQICTYDDFRRWSTANGMYMPDWRSDSYINLKIQACLEAWPTPTTIDASPSVTLQ